MKAFQAELHGTSYLAAPYALLSGGEELVIVGSDLSKCTAILFYGGGLDPLDGELKGMGSEDWPELERQLRATGAGQQRDKRPAGSGPEFQITTLESVIGSRDRYEAAHAIRALACKHAANIAWASKEDFADTIRTAEAQAKSLEQGYCDENDKPAEPPWREWLSDWGYE